MPVGVPGRGGPVFSVAAHAGAAWTRSRLAVATATDLGGARVASRCCAGCAESKGKREREGDHTESTTDRHSVGLPTPPAIFFLPQPFPDYLRSARRSKDILTLVMRTTQLGARSSGSGDEPGH